MANALFGQSLMRLWVADEGAQAPLAVFSTGQIQCGAYLNGTLRGSVQVDAAGGTLVCTQRTNRTAAGLTFTIPVDATHPPFSYPFSIIIIQPLVEFTFTNGGVATTFLLADVTADPIPL